MELIIIDQPSWGSGNSNCSDTGRQFFSDIGQASEIARVNEKMIEMVQERTTNAT